MNRTFRIGAIVAAVLATLALIVIAIIEPLDFLQGWLAAFVWASMIPVGSLILLLVNRLTGGEWGVPLGPALESAARAIAGVAFIAIPVLIFSAATYRWPEFALTPKSLTGVYMTAPLFALRTVIAFCIWGAIAWTPGLRSTALSSGIGLFALAIINKIIPVDLVVSAQPGYYSSDFGFGFGVEQILTALAFCAVLRATGDNEAESRNLAGMLIAGILGTVYMYYMEYAVIWYGNLPGKVDWFNNRGDAPWAEIGGVAFAFGAFLPFVFLLNDRVRGSSRWLRLIGAAVLFGELLHVIWMVVPSFGLAALLPCCVAVIVFAIAGSFWIAATGDRWQAIRTENTPAAQEND